MSKKDKKKSGGDSQAVPDTSSAVSPSVISKRGWKIIGTGIATVVLGFIVLSFTDPRGQNFASSLSPFLIIGGYILIGYGIVAKDPSQPS